ncbi:hypothetical protein BST81_24810 [Leptolyngbya sp. 'hensonii']|uniref:DUF2949 domain-containing protein n=1 Tax=Leptolyngbya sp. 'hensonii' TaxID=1922337 RepID=UPI0009500E08|nr:DUF2949 domain-containing protein [Leptolyngbya sp. 'hensonii']OLP15743.1 hypothetical protein BST81_24810 [Leptolyngbya sp. 'hensonii']
METDPQSLIIAFLREELAMPKSSIELALRQAEQVSGPLPIVLWQYGLITLPQLGEIFTRLEAHHPTQTWLLTLDQHNWK